MFSSSLVLLSCFLSSLVFARPGVSAQCPSSSCTAYDINSAKSNKSTCVRSDGTTGCVIGALWNGSILYCTPNPTRYPKYANGC